MIRMNQTNKKLSIFIASKLVKLSYQRLLVFGSLHTQTEVSAFRVVSTLRIEFVRENIGENWFLEGTSQWE